MGENGCVVHEKMWYRDSRKQKSEHRWDFEGEEERSVEERVRS